MMEWFLNQSARAKFAVAMGLMVALLATVIVTAYSGIQTIQQSQTRLFHTEFANATDRLDDLRHQNGIRAALLHILILDNGAEQEQWHQDVKARSQLSEAIHQRLLKRAQNDPASPGGFNELISLRTDFKQALEEQIIPLIYQGKTKEAEKAVNDLADQSNSWPSTPPLKRQRQVQGKGFAVVGARGKESRRAIEASDGTSTNHPERDSTSP